MGRGELRRRGGGLRARVCEATMSGGNILDSQKRLSVLAAVRLLRRDKSAPEPYLAVRSSEGTGRLQVALENAQPSAYFTWGGGIDRS